MRKPKSFTYLLFILYPFIFLAAMALLKLPGYDLVGPYHYLGWIALALCALVLLMPWGSIKLESDTPAPKRSTLQWLGFVLSIQASLFFMFIGTHYFIFHVLPVAQQPYTLHATLHTLWWQWGLFPWGFIALLAVHYAYIAFNKKQDAYLPRSVYPLLKFKDDSLFARILQVIVRNAITVVFGLSFGLLAIWFTTLLAGNTPELVPKGLHNQAFLTAIGIFLVIFLPPVRRGMAKILRRRMPVIFGIIGITAVMGVLILLFGTLFSTIPDNAVTASSHYKVLHELEHLGSKNLWLLFSIAWWSAWVPVCACFIGYFSRGRSIRACILVCVIPAALVIVGMHIFTDQLHLTIHAPNWLTFTLSALGFIGLISIIGRRKTQGMLIYSYIPKNGEHKYRDHHLLYRRAFQLAAGVVYLYLPAGLPYIVYMLIISLLPVNGLIVLSILALIKRLVKEPN